MDDKPREISLQVIGCGWGRTGTLSLKTALEIVGCKCYHMTEVFMHPWHAKDWIKVSDNPANEDTFVELHSALDRIFLAPSFTAAVDFPAASQYQKLLKYNPQAKVILTVRNKEKWYQSCEQTIFLTMPDYPLTSLGMRLIFRLGLPWPGFSEMFHKTMTRDAFHCQDTWNKDHILRAFDQHIEEVKRIVPASQLLLLDVTDRNTSDAEKWQQLCSFLGKPIPDAHVSFPHVNDSAEFRWKLWVYGWLGTVLGLVGLGLPFLFVKPCQYSFPDDVKMMKSNKTTKND